MTYIYKNHSLTHSCTHSYIHSSTHSFIYSLAKSFYVYFRGEWRRWWRRDTVTFCRQIQTCATPARCECRRCKYFHFHFHFLLEQLKQLILLAELKFIHFILWKKLILPRGVNRYSVEYLEVKTSCSPAWFDA